MQPNTSENSVLLGDPASEYQAAGRLLHRFRAWEVGNGNYTAGSNVLAAMALAISALRRPGAAVAFYEDTAVQTKGSFAISGSLTQSLVGETVISAIRRRQAAVQSHSEDWQRYRARIARMPHGGNPPKPQSGVAPLLERLKTGDEHMVLPWLEEFTKVLRMPTATNDELLRRPFLYASASGPRDIGHMANFAHLGRILVHVPVNDRADFGRLRAPVLRLMDGSHPGPGFSETVGDVIVSDPYGYMDSLIGEGDEGASWLVRMPWLVDVCPEHPIRAIECPGEKQISCVRKRFEKAVDRVLLDRVTGASDPDGFVLRTVPNAQKIWMDLLKKLEPAWPGIAGALRPFMASLVSGFFEIASGVNDAHGKNKAAADFNLSIEIMEFAHVLARRMVAYRQRHLRSARDAEMERLAAWLVRVLGGSPMSVRDITRRRHRLTADTCREALRRLESAGKVAEVGDRWSLSANPKPHSHVPDGAN